MYKGGERSIIVTENVNFNFNQRLTMLVHDSIIYSFMPKCACKTLNARRPLSIMKHNDENYIMFFDDFNNSRARVSTTIY